MIALSKCADCVDPIARVQVITAGNRVLIAAGRVKLERKGGQELCGLISANLGSVGRRTVCPADVSAGFQLRGERVILLDRAALNSVLGQVIQKHIAAKQCHTNLEVIVAHHALHISHGADCGLSTSEDLGTRCERVIEPVSKLGNVVVVAIELRDAGIKGCVVRGKVALGLHERRHIIDGNVAA